MGYTREISGVDGRPGPRIGVLVAGGRHGADNMMDPSQENVYPVLMLGDGEIKTVDFKMDLLFKEPRSQESTLTGGLRNMSLMRVNKSHFHINKKPFKDISHFIFKFGTNNRWTDR